MGNHHKWDLYINIWKSPLLDNSIVGFYISTYLILLGIYKSIDIIVGIDKSPLQGGAPKITKLVYNSHVTMVYGTQITIVFMG